MSPEAEVKALLERRAQAAHDKDIERLLACYAAEIVYFDLVPGLRYDGTEAMRARFLDWFGNFTSAIRQDAQDVVVIANGDLAVAWMLIRAGGTLKTGREVDYWVRTTDCCQRSNGRWSITHEHVSVPVELATGKAALDLVP